MQVTLVDEEKNPGGVCLYRGCIPSKALLHVAKVLDESKHAAAWGIEFGAAKVDLDKLRAYKNQVVDRLTGGTGQVAKLRKITYVQGRATITGPTSLSVKTAAGTQEVTSDYLVLATGLVSDEDSRAVDRQPAGARLDRRARPAGDSQDAAGRRRRLHRPGARLGLRRARHQGVGRRDDAGPAARRRPRPGQAAGPAHREDVRQGDAVDQGHRHGRRQERHRRDLRGRGRAGVGDLRLRAGLDRPPAELEDAGPGEDQGQGRTPRASSRPTASAAPPSRRCSPSATWPASRCWPTRPRTRRAWPSTRSPGTRSSSSRRRFRRWSSPIPRWPGPG